MPVMIMAWYLHVKIGAKDLNVEKFAFLRRAAVETKLVELEVVFVRSDEPLDRRFHDFPRCMDCQAEDGERKILRTPYS